MEFVRKLDKETHGSVTAVSDAVRLYIKHHGDVNAALAELRGNLVTAGEDAEAALATQKRTRR